MPPKDARGRGGPSGPGREANGRNEYIPSFISKKPFYVADEGSNKSTADDYLEHQRLQSTTPSSLATQQWYDRGRKSGPAATKFRKGACENCGSMTHKKKDCLSRPRKHGAKWTGEDIQADDMVQDVKMGWDAKRDRWNGYDASEYNNVIDQYNETEQLKKGLKSPDADGENGDDNAEGNKEDGDRYEEETDMGRQQATSTRNLRIREDTAKYLLNLDLDSARYDPKTRSMIDAGNVVDNAAALVAEEGFMKASGDAGEFERAQKYAWETQERGDKNKIHLQANPTSGEYFRKKEAEEAAAKRSAQKKALLDQYGAQEDFKRDVSKDVAVVENERFVEYDDRGKIKNAPAKKVKSIYTEDVLTNNHTSVWGSWWKDFKWGYACCHSTLKNSYCTGEVDQPKQLEQVEVPKQIAWEAEAQGEEFVPNAVDSDSKAKLDEQTRSKRKYDEATEDTNDGQSRKRLDQEGAKHVSVAS